jgi:lipopolysaccharide transport system ATP-binding protein
MTEAAIRVQGLSKRYRIGRPLANQTLREAVSDAIRAPFRAVHRLAAGAPRGDQESQIWALQDVSFEVARGETVGIIGPNGAGKSTLLKILSRITEPTAGRVEIHGRVASLLEVGTGFHPELTGRENVYLSGTFLGMRKSEIHSKFDAILEFSGIGKFADTPVKHYSSGMYVRLAFAVAAHLDPDILIVDEVLAVGDAAFQRKCLSKMEDVRQHGRTVLFVSHNMSAITRLCQRAILIAGGAIQQDGLAPQITSSYLLSSLKSMSERVWPDAATAPGDDVVRLRAIRIRTAEGATVEAADIREPVGVEMIYDVLKPGYCLAPRYEFFNESGLCVFSTLGLEPEWRTRARPMGRLVSTAWVPGNYLAEGTLFVAPRVFSPDPPRNHFYERDLVAFQVVDSLDGGAARGDWEGAMPGVVRPLLEWTTKPADLGERDLPTLPRSALRPR